MAGPDVEKLRDEKGRLPSFAWPGGYRIVYVAADGRCLCALCANEPEAQDATPDDRDWWLVDAHIHWEGPAETCAHCDTALPSELGIPDDD